MSEWNQQERDILNSFFQFERRLHFDKPLQILFERMFYKEGEWEEMVEK